MRISTGSRVLVLALMGLAAACHQRHTFEVPLPRDAEEADYALVVLALDDEALEYEPVAATRFFLPSSPPPSLAVAADPFTRLRLVLFLYQQGDLELAYELGTDPATTLLGSDTFIGADFGSPLAPRAPGMEFVTFPFGIDSAAPTLTRATTATALDVVTHVAESLRVSLPPAPAPPDPLDGTAHGFIVSSFDVPTDQATLDLIGRDLDGDGDTDTAVNNLLAAIESLLGDGFLDLAAVYGELLDNGDMILLVQTRALDLDDDPAVSVHLVQGLDLDLDPTDNFSGTEVFEVVDPDVPLVGVIDASAMLAGPGSVYLPTAVLTWFPQSGSAISVDGAFVVGRYAGSGIVEGGLTGHVDRDVAFMQFVAGINGAILAQSPTPGTLVPCTADADCGAGTTGSACSGSPGVCVDPGGLALALLQAYDADGDGMLTEAELKQIHALLIPDVDTDGDGIDDRLSFAASFSAVGASFAAIE